MWEKIAALFEKREYEFYWEGEAGYYGTATDNSHFHWYKEKCTLFKARRIWDVIAGSIWSYSICYKVDGGEWHHRRP